MEPFLVTQLYNWAYNISGSSRALLWVFMRPETFALLEGDDQTKRGAVTLRAPEPIHAPTLKEVVFKRIETFPHAFPDDWRKEIKVPLGKSYSFTPKDVQSAVSYVTSLALDKTSDMLPKLTDRADGGKEPNLRAGLQGLLGILGSHVMTDSEYATALLLRTNDNYISAIERWSRVLEAFILSRRNWYSSRCGAVENLFDPPNVEDHGDYLLLVHCLQSLCSDETRNRTIGELCGRLLRLGYSHERVSQAIRHLSDRRASLNDNDVQQTADPFCGRTFPLVTVGRPIYGVSDSDEQCVQISAWGEYHVRTLIEQAQYWKHMFYQIVLPFSIGRDLKPVAVHESNFVLQGQLDRIFNYLVAVEERWLRGLDENELTFIGVSRIIQKLRDKIRLQLQR